MTSGQRKLSWVLSGIVIAFLLMDAVGKFVQPQQVVDGTVELGYQASVILPLGVVLLIATALYAYPQTAILGAILLTGYLGGAVATHVRIGNPLLTHILFPVYLGIMAWGGLWLRDERVRSILPARK
jgi:hypothetical protein